MMSREKLSKAARYKRKISLLAGAAGLLAFVYLLSLFFDPERAAARSAAFTWLPPEGRDAADRVEILRPNEDRFVMIRREGNWFAETGAEQVPVKRGRIDDLFRILGTRGVFPRRGSSSSSHAALGLDSQSAVRLIIRGGVSAEPLLDLLTGGDDAAGREVYFRKNGENEYRSGDPLIKSYVTGEKTAWYDLKLFRENQADFVQRIQVSPLKDGEGDEEYVLARSGTAWVFEGSAGTPAADKADAYARQLFDIQGENFLQRTQAMNMAFAAAKLSVELGDGSVITVQAGEERDGAYPVTVSASPYIYLLSRPVLQRLFRKRSVL